MIFTFLYSPKKGDFNKTNLNLLYREKSLLSKAKNNELTMITTALSSKIKGEY